MLSTMQRIDGTIYTIGVTPLGDKLIVKPYRGDFGIFKIGPGNRDIKDISLQGSLSTESGGIAVGPDPTTPGTKQEKLPECEVPVGDYLPAYLTIEYGHLRLGISDSYHTEGKPRDMERRRTYGMKIRKDAPFVLDFTNKPDVVFASPAKDKTARPGDEVEVKAVLVDPVLDIMIRRLDDTRRNKKETVKPDKGQEYSYERPLSLDPQVTITDSAGKTVSEGVMPFG